MITAEPTQTVRDGMRERYRSERMKKQREQYTPEEKVAIHAERDRKLQAARQKRQSRRQQAA